MSLSNAMEMQEPRSGHELGIVMLDFDPALARPRKRSVKIAGHNTSITLEDAFWQELQGAAAEMETSVAALVAKIDAGRATAALSAAIRVFLFLRLRDRRLRRD